MRAVPAGGGTRPIGNYSPCEVDHDPHEVTQRPRSEPEGGTDLRSLIVRGVAWKGLSQIVIQLTRLAVALALARILAPEEYGIAAMALVFSGFVLIFADLALGQVLVQRPSLTQTDKTTAFWTSVAAGATFTVAGIAAAGPIAGFFDEPRLKSMIAALSFTFVISSVGTTQSALLVRKMDFRTLELRELAATGTGAAVALGGALAGWGAWAVVSQQIATTAVTTILVWVVSPWRPTAEYSRRSLRWFAGFSANVLGTQVLTQLRTATPNVVIGRALGASALGTYALAFNVILVPFNRIAVPIAQVLFPAMSRLQQDRVRLADYWRRSVLLLAAVAMPSLVGLIILAPEFVDTLLGNDWERAVPVLRLLAFVGLLQTLQFLNPVVLLTLDRTTLLFRWTILSFGAMLAALFIGLHWGIVGVAVAIAAAAAVTETAYGWLTSRLLGIPFLRVVGDLARVGQATALMAAVVVAGRISLAAMGVPAGMRLLLLGLLGAVVFVLALAWRAPDVVRDARSVRRRSGDERSRAEPSSSIA